MLMMENKGFFLICIRFGSSELRRLTRALMRFPPVAGNPEIYQLYPLHDTKQVEYRRSLLQKLRCSKSHSVCALVFFAFRKHHHSILLCTRVYKVLILIQTPHKLNDKRNFQLFVYVLKKGNSQPTGPVSARIVLALSVSTQTPINYIFFES